MNLHQTSVEPASYGWFGDWLMSPGFGGAAAVLAAGLALVGVWRNVTARRESDRKQQWWERARWALDLILDDDPSARDVGLAVLEALADSEYADQHEAEVIDAAVSVVLDAYFDQSDETDAGGDVAGGSDETAGVPAPDPAHLEHPGKESDDG